MKWITLLLCVSSASSLSLAADDSEVQALRKQVQELTERVKKLETLVAPLAEKTESEGRIERQRVKARERMSKDAENYSRMQLREIEALYQVANQKWQTEEGKNSLKDLVKKYDKANRTGCALLYLGQMSDGAEKEEYLHKAIADFSDCWYGDGVQVGPFARYVLADHYRASDKKEKADELVEQLKKQFPDAIDHSGKLLVDGQ